MLRRSHVFMALLVICIPFAVDYAIAQRRLEQVELSASLDVPSVVADGKSRVSITIRVTENGVPRKGDTLQAWIQVGGGLLQPQWAFTDENGEATLRFSPNPLTRYDVGDHASITIRNISIGTLIEVGKEVSVEIPLETPAEEDRGGGILG